MKLTHYLATCALVTVVGGGVWADDGRQKSPAKDKRAQVKQQQGDKQAKQDKHSPGQSFKGAQAQYRLSPAGWVQIAVDYDGDGLFDGIETIYAYDFEKARKSSRERANRDAQKLSSEQKNRQEQQDQTSRQASASEKISGKLLQLRDEQILGIDEKCVVARIRKDNNMPAKVVLGRKSNVDSWSLAEGDEITVSGTKGRINDRPVLLAQSVSWGDTTQQVDLPSSRNSKRVKAEVLSLRTAQFKGHDGQFMIAKIQSPSGKQCEVNLGLKSKVDPLNLQEGDQLKMIVRPAKVNGQPGMVADQITANDKQVQVSPPQQAMRRRDKQSQQAKQAQQLQQAKRDRNEPSQQARQSSDENPAGEAALGIAIGETGEGVVVIGIHPDSPLADADVQVGDAIRSINGQDIQSADQLISMIREMKAGKSVKLKTDREGEENTVEAKLTSRQKLMQSYR